MLTWRDLQHIVVMTAKPDYLHDNTWITNGVDRKGVPLTDILLPLYIGTALDLQSCIINESKH
jgi:hypothetical protein